MAKFLIVDDSKIARNFLKNMLTEEGHEIIGEAADGLTGYDMYAQYKPDIITLDITMPVVSGIECLRKIIKNFADAKVVMVTSVGKDKLVQEAMGIGAKFVLVKPFEKEEAMAVLTTVLERK